MFTIVVSFVCSYLGTTAAEESTWFQFGGPKRNHTLETVQVVTAGTDVLWREKLGPGTSGIVSDGQRLFTLYSVPDAKDKKKKGEEIIVALQRTTGKKIWEQRYPIAAYPKQENFGGDPIQPQATPAVVQDRLCTLGYSGWLKGLDTATGKVIWEKDLVQELEATPVQFGFAASPLVYDGQFIVHVGGKQACLIALQPKDGKILWKSEPAEPSYASPVVLKIGSEDQIVQVTRDAIIGYAAKTGETRWTYPMPKVGLTNVPTPLVLSEQRLLVSGQGILGTRLLQVEAKGNQYNISELWKNTQATWFYSNWVVDNDTVYGSIGNLFGALNLADGTERWRERGQANANLIRIGSECFVLRGDGQLTRSSLNKDEWKPTATLPLLKSRCWAAPTLINDILYARDTDEITAIPVGAIKNK